MNLRTLLSAVLSVVLLTSMAVGQSASGPKVGSQIKDFSLVDQFDTDQKLSDLLADGPIALVVLRSAGWCAMSKQQLIDLQQNRKSIEATGIRVVGLSFDKTEVLADFSSVNDIEFPLLADPTSKVIEQLGIVNTSRKKGTLRYKVAYPLTILIKRDRTVAGVVRGDTKTTLHDFKKLISAWTGVKPEEEKPEKKTTDFIKVLGNQFVDQTGDPVRFRGVAIADPYKVLKDGHWKKQHFEQIKSWGFNLVRIPVHPQRMRKLGMENYLKLLDDAVNWCDELEMHVIIDWHSMGNLRAEKFQEDEYKTTMKETLKFWDVVSKRFAGNPTVAFYEIFNEPTVYNGTLGKCTWPQWKAIVEEIIDVIYANDKNVIPLVSGFNWAYDLREVRTNPIDRPGIGYVTHPYPGKCKPPRESHWDEHFGFLTSRYPVFATEIGFSLDGNVVFKDQDRTYQKAILKYLDRKGISWCAWTFDPDWSPALIKSYQYGRTDSGTFFRRALQKTSTNK
ncbi:cellulase family glycosylhydrolase [Mariniblastus sp.]|nr:cellulase family glycosylhydrolase [Mariniblastus sp.]